MERQSRFIYFRPRPHGSVKRLTDSYAKKYNTQEIELAPFDTDRWYEL